MRLQLIVLSLLTILLNSDAAAQFFPRKLDLEVTAPHKANGYRFVGVRNYRLKTVGEYNRVIMVAVKPEEIDIQIRYWEEVLGYLSEPWIADLLDLDKKQRENIKIIGRQIRDIDRLLQKKVGANPDDDPFDEKQDRSFNLRRSKFIEKRDKEFYELGGNEVEKRFRREVWNEQTKQRFNQLLLQLKLDGYGLANVLLNSNLGDELELTEDQRKLIRRTSQQSIAPIRKRLLDLLEDVDRSIIGGLSEKQQVEYRKLRGKSLVQHDSLNFHALLKQLDVETALMEVGTPLPVRLEDLEDGADDNTSRVREIHGRNLIGFGDFKYPNPVHAGFGCDFVLWEDPFKRFVFEPQNLGRIEINYLYGWIDLLGLKNVQQQIGKDAGEKLQLLKDIDSKFVRSYHASEPVAWAEMRSKGFDDVSDEFFYSHLTEIHRSILEPHLKEAKAKYEAVLDAGDRRKLTEISIQLNEHQFGLPLMLVRGELGRKLQITPEQKQEINIVSKRLRSKIQLELVEILNGSTEKILGTLTPSQRSEFRAKRGKSFGIKPILNFDKILDLMTFPK